MADGVVIRITGDDSDFEGKLKSAEKSATQAAASIGKAYQKAGMTQSEAMRKAWAEVKSAQQNGTSVMINGVETFIRKNDEMIRHVDNVPKNAYKPLGTSADSAADQVSNSLDKIERKSKSTFSGIKKAAGLAFGGVGTVFKGVATVTGIVGAGIGAAGLATVNYTANIEQLQASFETMTGSASKAQSVIDRIRKMKMGADTPFEMTDLAEVTQLLMNYGLQADNALDKMTMLGDIAQGNADKMKSVATAYGQMSSAGKVSLEDVKQMIEAGFNPLQIISEKTGESMASLYDRISKGTLAVSEITAAMEAATSAGGKYYQSMQKQSETINGMISTIKDNGQQLLGKVFEPVTDGLSDTVLPGVIAMMDEMDAAFEKNGFDGLSDALLAQVPKLTKAGVKAAQSVLSGVSKKLPSLAKGLLSSSPDLLDAAGELAPDLTDALFDLAAVSVEGLVGMLPELVPTLISGAGSMLASVYNGLLGVAGGFFRGFGTALKKMGVLEWSTEELIAQAFENVDREHVEAIKAKISVDPDLELAEDPTTELTSLYSEIEQALTDGEADTEEIVSGLKDKVTAYYTGQIEKINEWRTAALAGLDDTLPQEEYDAAAAEINSQADSIIANLGTASDTAVAFVEEMAGKPTAVVQANLGTLESYLSEAEEIVKQVAQLTGETGKTVTEAQREIVAAGMSTDEGVQINAIETTAAEYEAAVKAAEEKKAAALVEAAKKFAEGTAEYETLEQAAQAEYDVATASAKRSLEDNMAMLWQGIARAMDPEAMEAIDTYKANQAIKDRVMSVLTGMQEALEDPDLPEGGSELQEYVRRMLEGSELTEADWATIAAENGLSVEELRSAFGDLIAQNLQEAMNGGDLRNPIGMLQLSEFFEFDNSQLSEAANTLAPIITVALESGYMNGVEGVDLSNPEQLIEYLMTDFGNFAAATIGDTKIEGEPDVNINPTVNQSSAEQAQQEVAQAVENAAESAEPLNVEQPVEVTAEASTDESGIQSAVETELKEQTMSVDVKAAVKLDVTVSDSNATAVGTAAGVQLGDGIIAGVESKSDGVSASGAALGTQAASGARTAYGQMKAAGIYLGTGFQLGLASKRQSIINTARSIADSAARAIKATLQINSPSRLSFGYGEYFGEGFELGAVKSFRHAISSINSVVGSVNLRSQMNSPDFEGALTSATQAIYSAEEMRPIQLVLNGKVMGQVLSRPVQVATNQFNRSIDIGYGGAG